MYEKSDPESLILEVPAYIKKQFVTKVYSLVSLQILTTAAISFLMISNDRINKFVSQYPDIYTGSMIISFVSLMTFPCFHRKYPYNIALFSLFTISESVLIGFICAIYVNHGQGMLIIYSFSLTWFIFVCLSIYVHVSKQDFQFLEPFLISGVIVLIFASLLFMVFSVSSFSIFIASGGILLFTGFILYDTSNLLHNLTVDDALIGAMQLYTDVINMFLYVLQCLTVSSRQ